MVTDAQKQNIRRLSKNDLIEIFNICKEELGILSVKEFILATGIKRSTVYYMIKNNKINFIKINEHYFILINCL